MTRSARFRPLLTCLGLLLLVFGLPTRSPALAEIEEVSKERAKELGISVTSRPSANKDAWVQVEFKTTGALKGFRWADLELTQGGKRLVTASLLPRNSPPDTVRLDFYMDPAALPQAMVTVFVYRGLEGIGYQLKMKDFLPPASR